MKRHTHKKACELSRHRLRTGRRGAVQMEYILLAVLIAAAVVLAVMTFNRSLITNIHAASNATVQETEKAAENLDMRRGDRLEDLNDSDTYREVIHNQ